MILPTMVLNILVLEVNMLKFYKTVSVPLLVHENSVWATIKATESGIHAQQNFYES